MCGSKFSWPPHCPQCSDWWEWQPVHVSSNFYRVLLLSNSLQVTSSIRLVGEELYTLCEGSKTVQISPIDIGLACYDELLMDINMSSVFVQLCQGIMTVGQTVLPPALNQKEYPSFKRFKTQKDEAVLKLQENEKKIINFLPQPKPWEESQRTLKTWCMGGACESGAKLWGQE